MWKSFRPRGSRLVMQLSKQASGNFLIPVGNKKKINKYYSFSAPKKARRYVLLLKFHSTSRFLIKIFVVLIESLQFSLHAIGNVFFDKACLVLYWGFSSCAKFENIFKIFYDFVMSDNMSDALSFCVTPSIGSVVMMHESTAGPSHGSGRPVYNPNINSYPNPNTYPSPNLVWPGVVSSSLFRTRLIICSKPGRNAGRGRQHARQMK